MNILYAVITLLCLIFFLAEPELILEASLNAINTWFASVLPALLPFFILNNLAMTYGGIKLLGALLQPVTRKIFNLPGEVGFILATGYSTGAPVSAISIAALHNEGIISARTANMLLPITANVSPLFIFSVVAASFLGRGDLGLPLALIHYGTNIVLGTLCLLAFRPAQKEPAVNMREAIKKLEKESHISIGQGLSDAVLDSLKTIGLICGLMIVFFIILDIIHYFSLDILLGNILQYWGINREITQCLIKGITEITAGTQCAAAMNLPINTKFSLISLILAFGGISALCQIATQIKNTDLSMKFYLFYKSIQAVTAFLISLFVSIPEQTASFNTGHIISPKNTLFTLIPFAAILALIILLLILRHHHQHRRWRKERSFYL